MPFKFHFNVFVLFTDPWIPDEINNGHVEYFFFLLAGLMVVNFFIFILIAKR